ncbi:MAG: hypothetical protein ACKO0W_01055, partial [Planctomycetota bacterium]
MSISRSSSRHPAFALSISVALAGGCRSYGPSPLALDAHEATFVARDASASEVAEFARSLAPAGAGAAAFDPSDGLSVGEAEIVALVFNPDLRERRLAAGIAAAGAAHAADWDDPREFAARLERAHEGIDLLDPGAVDLGGPDAGCGRGDPDEAAAHVRAHQPFVACELLERDDVFGVRLCLLDLEPPRDRNRERERADRLPIAAIEDARQVEP